MVWRVSENGRGEKGIREWIELKLNHNKVPEYYRIKEVKEGLYTYACRRCGYARRGGYI